MEKIWLKNYIQGVPAEINPDTYPSLVAVLEASCQQYADQPAFYSLGVTLTYKQIDNYSRDFAAYLQQDLKLAKGSRVAIMLPNVLQYPIVMLGILRAGMIAVNVNPLYTPRELTHQLKDSGTEAIIVLANFANVVQVAKLDTSLKNVIVTQVGDLFPLPKAWIVNFIIKYVKKKIPAWCIADAISFKAALAAGKKYTLSPVTLRGEDIAFLQYTGGTTGVSKGAILTHRNLVANLEQIEAWCDPILDKGKEIFITALPLYHIFSLTANCLFVMKIGGLNLLLINARDTDQVVSEISKFKFTVVTGVNTLYNLLLKHPKFAKLNFSGLKICLGGGMAVQSAVAEKWKNTTGSIILEAYGLTETSPCVCINPVNLKKYNGTIGLPVSSTNICIVDDDHQEVPIGQSGELAIKGPQVMRGYWQNSAETQKVFTKDGWLLTGDIASINEEGFVDLLERKKDMILVSGFNVYPNEVEDVLASMTGVREAAVIAVADESAGEVPKAFVVRDNKDITAEEVITFCHTKLTGYKIPRYVEFCDELPKTNVGKVLRRALRQSEPPSLK